MKLIIAVTFFGILMPEAFSFQNEYCKLIQAADNFTDQYWKIEKEFVTYSKYNPEAVCREYVTSSGGATTTITANFQIGGKSQNTKFQCTNEKKIQGQFLARCTIVEGGEQYKSTEGTGEGTPAEGAAEGGGPEGSQTEGGETEGGETEEGETEGGPEKEVSPQEPEGEGSTEGTEEGTPTAEAEEENSPAGTETDEEGAETEPSGGESTGEGADTELSNQEETKTLVEGKEAGSPTILVEASVIVTDNEKYSILHTCSYDEKKPTRPTYNILLMQTEEKGELPKEVTERFDDNQGFWAINTWHKKGSVNCNSIQNQTDTGKL